MFEKDATKKTRDYWKDSSFAEFVAEAYKQEEILLCEKYLKYLRKPHWSWDILLRPLRIYYYSRKLKKLKETDKE